MVEDGVPDVNGTAFGTGVNGNAISTSENGLSDYNVEPEIAAGRGGTSVPGWLASIGFAILYGLACPAAFLSMFCELQHLLN